MQVVNWLPRTELPFAAPSRPELLQALEPYEAFESSGEEAAAPVAVVKPTPEARPAVERAKIEVPRPAPVTKAVKVADEAAPVTKAPVVPPPRFALQLLRAGRCLLLVELPTGERFQSRDPAYLLLKEMLRAAGLPDSPQIVGEPVRWPLLVRGTMDQGPEAARDFVQGFVSARLEDEPCV
ncbi:energy transducer TonB, partial [Pseudomonas lactis]